MSSVGRADPERGEEMGLLGKGHDGVERKTSSKGEGELGCKTAERADWRKPIGRRSRGASDEGEGSRAAPMAAMLPTRRCEERQEVALSCRLDRRVSWSVLDVRVSIGVRRRPCRDDRTGPSSISKCALAQHFVPTPFAQTLAECREEQRLEGHERVGRGRRHGLGDSSAGSTVAS